MWVWRNVTIFEGCELTCLAWIFVRQLMDGVLEACALGGGTVL